MPDPTSISKYLMILIAWGGAFLAALWLSLIIWTYRDIRLRARDPLARILAVLVVAILFLPGIVVYLILRPARTLDDEYQHTLEEEALLSTIEEVSSCPGCSRRVKEDWTVCPNCQTKLKKPCHTCGKLMELPWNICPFCGTPAPGMRREGMTMDEALRTIPLDAEAESELEEEILPDFDIEEVDIEEGEEETPESES
jgi:RNA polymerase subunit RPABC4/transcription elongation factor Spt4